jgi:hypothetical protein
MRQVGRRGTAEAPTNGHGKPQGTDPPAPASAGSHTSHDAWPRVEDSAPSLSS